MEQGLITFFDVKQAGFYRLKKGKQVHVEGSLSETLDKIIDWVRGRDFDQTIPWNPKAAEHRPRIYCKSAKKCPNSGDYFFVFWKGYGQDHGNLNGVYAKSKVGATENDTHKVSNQAKGKDIIYGEALYYWFIPEHDLIASVKFPHSIADSTSVFNYIKKCIDLRIEHPRKEISENEQFNHLLGKELTTQSVRYKSEDNSYSLTFKIEAKLKELSLKQSSLEALAKNITHLVIRETISSTKTVEKNGIFKMYDLITRKDNQIDMSKQVEIITEETVTSKDLARILQTYDSEHDSDSKWDNVGFRENDGPTTKWFDSYLERKRVIIDSKHKIDQMYFTARRLMTEINAERSSLLDWIKEEETDQLNINLHQESSEDEKLTAS